MILQILKTKAESWSILLEQIWLNSKVAPRNLCWILQHFALQLLSFTENNIPIKDLYNCKDNLSKWR